MALADKAFSQLHFQSTANGGRSFLELSAKYLVGTQVRVLDLGCGSGTFCQLLSDLPNISLVTGLDISPENIRAAKAREPRAEFVCADYLASPLQPYDMIFADSVLQWIPGTSECLIEKLSADLNPGGLLIFTMPDRSFLNQLQFVVRRFLRRIRSRILDNVMLGFGRMIFRNWTQEELRSRLEYLYLVPRRLLNFKFVELLKNNRLQELEDRRWPQSRWPKPQHRYLVFRKEDQ